MSALPIPAAHDSPAKPGGRKAPAKARQSRSRADADAAPAARPFYGKNFVGFENWILDAIRHGANSLAEMNLILYIAEMANDRERGNVFARTAPIMPKALSDQIGCTTQNINCSASVWFYDAAVAKAGDPTGLIERFEHKKRKPAAGAPYDAAADSRAFSYQIRADYIRTWLKHRLEAREREQAEREAAAERRRQLAAEAEQSEKKAPRFALSKPVRVSPSKPFRLPESAREAIRTNCTAITSKREGTITDLRVTPKGVLIFDFDAAPASAAETEIDKSTCRPSPPPPSAKERRNDKPTCRLENADAENKGLTGLDARTLQANATNPGACLAGLAAGLKSRRLVATREQAERVLTEIGLIPVSFFLKTLDTKIQKAKARGSSYSPSWLVRTAKDAVSAWQLDQLAADSPAGAEQPAEDYWTARMRQLREDSLEDENGG